MFVQALGQDVVDDAVLVLCAQATQEALRPRARGFGGRSGDGLQRLLRVVEAVSNRTRKELFENEKLDHRAVLEATVPLAVHLERAHRAQERRKVNLLEAGADLRLTRQKKHGLRVHDAAPVDGEDA